MNLELLRNINSWKSKNLQRRIYEKERTKELIFFDVVCTVHHIAMC